MNKEHTNIDQIIVDLIIDHYNVQSFEGKRGTLTATDFDAICDVAESIFFKKVAIQEKPALA
tara:strand:- start:116 stop:301 length:186 start_codon:yes stop_codon:yes gene_type:complete